MFIKNHLSDRLEQGRSESAVVSNGVTFVLCSRVLPENRCNKSMKRCLSALMAVMLMGFFFGTPLPAHAIAGALPGEPLARIRLNFTDVQKESLLRPKTEEALRLFHEERKAVLEEVTATKRMRMEQAVIEKVLRSEGFYQAKVLHSYEEERFIYTITPGRRYILRDVKVESAIEDLPAAEALGLTPGDPLRAEAVLNAVDQLRRYVQEHDCLWRVEVGYDATVFHETGDAEVVLTVADSPQVRYGQVTLTEHESVDAEYLHRKIPLEEGGCFRRSALEKTRLKLLRTGLLSHVETKLSREGQKVDVTFHVTERKHRTVKAGADYSSDEGIGITAAWEHRNFLGGGEKLEAEGRVSELYQRAQTTLTLPAFLREDQTLSLDGEIADERLDAYDARSIETSVSLKRQFDKRLSGSIGSSYSVSSVEKLGEEEAYALLGFPVSLEYDRRDSTLDPRKGWLLAGKVTPFTNTLDTGTSFFKMAVGGNAYYTLDDSRWEPTLALRVATGSITGQHIEAIPPDERFYTGGGGSVRGYPYQKLGPLEDGVPAGGRSFAEISLESRLRFGKNWGGVVFVDGGNTYDEIAPQFGEELRWAVGTGVRYYTGFAPIRFDVAFPLERRRGVDDRYQFYISIGQAF